LTRQSFPQASRSFWFPSSPPPPRLYEPALAAGGAADPARETEGDHAG